MPGNGKANAFALGYAKSLSAELYPKIRYEWNFILQKISNLKNLSKSSHMNEENSKERWLITGGLGGIGWQMAIFIAYNRKISHLILLGRKQPNEAQNREIHKIRDSLGVDVRAVSVDLTSKMEMKKFFEKLQITLTSIIHSAGCLHDALASKQNLSTFRLVTEAKCDGLLILEKLCHSHPIKHFIVNSSVSAIIGNRGQCNYSAANAFIDEIMLERRAKKLPATIINWEIGRKLEWLVGEIVACTLADRITLDDALKLVIRRGQILRFIKGKGKMIAVKKNDAEKFQRYSGMDRAAENSDKQIVLSGDNHSARLCSHFARLYQYSITVIDDCYPFHSSIIHDTLLHEYAMECKNECVKTLNNNGTNIWLEIGNGEILSTFVRSMLGFNLSNMLICSSIKSDKQEVDSFIHSLCEIQNLGIKIKWDRICDKTDIDNVQEITKIYQEKTEKKLMIGKEKYMELIEQHLIYDEIILPAAFIIAMFTEFIINSSETCTSKLKMQQRNRRGRSASILERGRSSIECERSSIERERSSVERERSSIERETIIFEALRLERRINENDLSKLQIKFNSSELILTDGINKYSTCRISNKEYLEQMKHINILNKLRIDYKQLKIRINELSHEAFYETMRKRGLQYGLKYQILREIYRKRRYIVATLINADNLTIILDGALQLLSAALLTDNKSIIYIPFAIDNIMIKYDMKTTCNHFQAYGIITECTDNIIKGSVIIYEGDDAMIILHNVTAIDISTNKFITSIKPDNHSDSRYLVNRKMKNYSSNKDKNDNVRNINTDNTSITTGIKKDENSPVLNETLQIEIISYVGQFPGSAVDCASLWNNLKSGESYHLSGNIQRLQADITTFNPVQFGITPKEAAYIDPQQRILLELAEKIVEKIGAERLNNETGVFIGVSSNDFAQKAYQEIQHTCSYLSTGTNQSVLAGRIAYWFNLNGPTMVIDTACSSFFSALAVACDNIKMGNCRAALVGAVNIILNSKPSSVLENAQMLSKTGFCKVFDADADGYVRSEGAAMILIQGVNEKFTIESYGIAHNGRSNGLTVPNSISEYELINRVSRKCANISTISWVEAHATGTPLGDPIEMKAIIKALADTSCSDHSIHITSVKSSLGHCEAMAGAASLIMALEAYHHRYLPSIQHFKLLNTNIINNSSLVVPVIGEELPDTFEMLINSFGFSGTNVSIVLRGSSRREMRENVKVSNHLITKQRLLSFDHSPCILLCSANDSGSFNLASEKLEEYLKRTNQNLATVCACLQNLRNTGRYRIAIPIKRHTQQLTFSGISAKPEKWMKIAFNMGKKKYWPFADCNMQNDDYNFTNDEILISDLQPEMPQEMKELDKSNSMIVDHLTNNIFDNVEMESINHHQYLYKLVQKKCILSDPKQATPFIAINLIDTTTIIAQQAIAIVKINDNNDITKIKEQINLHKCTKLVLEWIIDDENLLESTIKQSMLIINLWQILVNNNNNHNNNDNNDNSNNFNTNIKLCLIVFAITDIKENHRLFAPYSALLKTLAMEQSIVNFKSIHIDIINEQIFHEILDENFFNEIIYYNNGNRYVERLQRMNDTELIIKQIRNLKRILITGNIRGIAIELIKMLKPHLAIVVSRSMPNECYNDENDIVIKTIQADCTDYEQMKKLLRHLRHSMSSFIAQQRLIIIRKIVAFSSAATILGSAGQANYVVANELLEYMMRRDMPEGLFISWGPWDGRGLLIDDLHSNPKSVKDFSEIIMNCITEVSGITDVKPDIGFMSMGIDSLMIAEMQELLNERLNLNISVAIFYEYSTVETLSQYIAQNILAKYKLHDDVKIKDIDDEVAIIGYSGAFSGATDDATFWTSLLDGKELIERQERTTNDNQEIIEAIGMVPNIDKFDYRFWKMSPDDATYIDPQIRKFVEHAYIALERSGLIRFRNKLRIAVIVGAEPSEYRPKSRRIGGIEDLYEMNQKDFVAAWTSHLLDLRGPSFGVYSACSTALVAIIQARNLLRENQCDIALAGAVSLAIPHTEDSDNIVKGMVLSSDGHCRPFDHQSSGTVRGSGVGVVVLQRIREIQQTNTPMIAKIIGYGISNDGLIKSSFMAPNISGQYECMKQAIEMAGTTEMDYIECHGTGTTTGDLIEFTAMSQLYHRDTLISSVKANIGHALAAAGIGSIIKLCKIAEMRIIPKQINFDKLNENLNDVSFNIIQSNVEIPKEKLRFAVNASGIGGTNAHIIMENDNRLYHLSSYQQTIKQYFYALTISAQTENACIQLCNRIADYLKSEMNLAQIASTLQNYREHFQYRIAEQLRSWNIDAYQMIGHSLGEYVAAAQANVFDVETALKILFKRGCLIAKTEKAKMLAFIYGFNTRRICSFLKNFTFRKPTRQILSNIDGQLITHFDSKYMVEHMRSTIRIDKCIKNLHSDIKVIIEIGPKGIVESLLKDDSREIEVISTLPSRKQYEKGYDTGDLLNIATKLWMKGYELNWEKICGNYGFDRLLPNYQFEKDICWENDQIKKWNMEKFEINLYEPYWIPYKFSTTHKRLPKGVLLFLPMIFTKSINTLLTMLHNLFIPIQCIFDDISSSKNFTIKMAIFT
ncbi:Beta-ketoacyl synthase protein [Dirofilaria immitis]|nr:Beta-ketoacyl synthase protein [Dirofilaria immitis]